MQRRGFQKWNTSTLLGVYVAIYDLLLDDDEDLRDRAAAVASGFLSTWNSDAASPNISLMPPAASSSLFNYVKTEFKESVLLLAEAVCRLTGTRSLFTRGPCGISRSGASDHEIADNATKASDTDWKPSVSIRPVRELMQEVIQEDTALFAEEKQNLFVDPAREAVNWVMILMSSTAFGEADSVISAVKNWAMQGLEVLIETATNQEDGPLGWTTKPDSFSLGIRVLLAAKITIHWSKTGLKKDTSLEDTLILLQRLYDIGKKNLMNGIWVQLIKDILAQEAKIQEDNATFARVISRSVMC